MVIDGVLSLIAGVSAPRRVGSGVTHLFQAEVFLFHSSVLASVGLSTGFGVSVVLVVVLAFRGLAVGSFVGVGKVVLKW